MSSSRRAERQERRRGQWYLLTGLILGLVVGLLVSWLILPVRYIDTAPDSLTAAGKDQYRSLIALAYAADGNLARAEARLRLLGDADPAQALAAQAQAYLSAGGRDVEARALAVLGADFSSGQASNPARGNTPDASMDVTPTLLATLPNEEAVRTATQRPTATRTPMPTFTPRPTKNTQPTLGAPFKLGDSAAVCSEDVVPGLLMVEVYDQQGKPVFGQRVVIIWSGGEEAFYTGLHPKEDAGYADYLMIAGVTYVVRVGDGGELSGEISIPDCDGQPGGWRVEFRQP